MTDLGTVGAGNSSASGINERGQIVGTGNTVSGYSQRDALGAPRMTPVQEHDKLRAGTAVRSLFLI